MLHHRIIGSVVSATALLVNVAAADGLSHGLAHAKRALITVADGNLHVKRPLVTVADGNVYAKRPLVVA